MDNSEESLLGMSQALLSAGVTSFLPTALTAPFEELKAICQTTAETVGMSLVLKSRDSSLKDRISLRSIMAERKILNTWATQVSNSCKPGKEVLKES